MKYWKKFNKIGFLLKNTKKKQYYLSKFYITYINFSFSPPPHCINFYQLIYLLMFLLTNFPKQLKLLLSKIILIQK